jgi:Flp pilus assembly protein TadG
MCCRSIISKLKVATKLALFKFSKASSGSVAILFGLFFPTLIMGLAVAVDVAVFNQRASQLQAAADASAVAGAKELALPNSKDSTIASAVEAFKTQNLDNIAKATASDTKVDRAKQSVTVTLSNVWEPFMGQYLGLTQSPIVVNATASLMGTTNVCLLALGLDGQGALDMRKTAKITANGCSVAANSIHARAIKLDDDSAIKAESTCSAGGIDHESGSIKAEPETDCVAIPDPLADRPEPTPGGCTGQPSIFKTGSTTLSPDTFCEGIKISGSARVILKPGVYIIKSDRFEVSGDATLEGDDVTIFLADDKALVAFNNDATIRLSGAKSGATAGLLFFGSRSQSIGVNHRIKATHAEKLTGTIYLPNGDLLIDPNSKIAEKSAYTTIIANTIRLNEGPELVLNSDYGSSSVPLPEGLRPTARVMLSN